MSRMTGSSYGGEGPTAEMAGLPHNIRSERALASAGFVERPVLARRSGVSVLLAAMLTSVVLHATFLVIGSVIYLSSARAIDEPQVAGAVGAAIAVSTITEAELGDLNLGAMDAAGPSVDDNSMTSGMMATLPGIETSGGQAVAGSGDLGGSGSGLGGAGSGDGIGVGDGTGGSGGGGAKFFGVEARGARFAFVVDVSGSMGGQKLESLKEQLTGSISGIVDSGSYIVIPFSSGPQPLHPAVKWMDASAKNKKDSTTLIRRLEAAGGTDPLGSFQMVFGMRPRPDAIYFMTDGVFDDSIVETIAKLNRGARKVPIHCIALLDDSGGELLKRIARDSDGTYTHFKGARNK